MIKKSLYIMSCIITTPLYMVGVFLVTICLTVNSFMDDWADEK